VNQLCAKPSLASGGTPGLQSPSAPLVACSAGMLNDSRLGDLLQRRRKMPGMNLEAQKLKSYS
jgi:hypothetical protein